MTKDDNLSKIIFNAKNGSEKDFEEILKRGKPLIHWAKSRYKSCSIDSHDIESIVLYGLYDAVLSYQDGDKGFFQYAKEVIKKDIYNHIEHINSKKYTAFSEVELFEDSLPSCVPFSPTEDKVIKDIEDTKKIELIKGIVETKLLDSHKDVFYMYFVDELSIGEIAEKLNINYNASAKRLERMIAKIKNILKEECFE